MQFYAYLWLRPDNTPYYAGKGKGMRAFRRTTHYVRPPAPSLVMIFPRGSEAEAFATERELIANWGRKNLGTGCLRNLTDGGEGTSGRVHTEETKKKIGAKHRGRKASAETKQRIGDGRRGRHHTAATKRRLSLAAKARPSNRLGVPHTPETLAKISEALHGRVFSSAHRSHLSLSQIGNKKFLGRSHSNQTKQALRAAALARWARKRETSE